MTTYTNNNSGSFDSCNKKVAQFVLDTYLQVKISSLTGVGLKDVDDNTQLTIPNNYNNDEGVLKKLDEEAGVKGLRIDLQKAQKVNNNTYATLQVQWGTGNKKNVGGAYAGVLMRCSHAFTLAEIRTALTNSFGWGKYCRLDP